MRIFAALGVCLILHSLFYVPLVLADDAYPPLKTEEPRNAGKEAILVNEKELRALIDGLDLGDEKRKEYIKARWLNYVLWWDSRAAQAKWWYFALRSAVVIFGALIPALVGLREMNRWPKWNWVFAVASVVASLVVAICAGLESLYSFGDIWREKRAAAELIKIEGFRFFQLTGDYKQDNKSHGDLYATFAANVEEIIEREIKDYVIAVKPEDK